MGLSRDELCEVILSTVVEKWEAAQAAPKPAAWKRFEFERWELDREYGPKWSPGWLGDLAASEAGRVRALRALYKLVDAGLVIAVRSYHGNKLERVRPTDAGIEAAGSMAAKGGERAEP
jgi:hypothetical protein